MLSRGGRPSAMRRLRLVRPCPEVPPGLEASLDRTGTGFCDRCGETVTDLTRTDAVVEIKPNGRTCARVLVSAALLATASACSSSAAGPDTQQPIVITTPPRPDAGPLDDRIYMLGEIDIDPEPTPPPPPAPQRR